MHTSNTQYLIFHDGSKDHGGFSMACRWIFHPHIQTVFKNNPSTRTSKSIFIVLSHVQISSSEHLVTQYIHHVTLIRRVDSVIASIMYHTNWYYKLIRDGMGPMKKYGTFFSSVILVLIQQPSGDTRIFRFHFACDNVVWWQ